MVSEMNLEEEIDKMVHYEIDIEDRIRKISKRDLEELVNKIGDVTEKAMSEYAYWKWYLVNLLNIVDEIYGMLSSAEYYEERGLSIEEMKRIGDKAFEIGKKIRRFGLK